MTQEKCVLLTTTISFAQKVIAECQQRLVIPETQGTHLIKVRDHEYAIVPDQVEEGNRVGLTQNPFLATWLTRQKAEELAPLIQDPLKKPIGKPIYWKDALEGTLEHMDELIQFNQKMLAELGGNSDPIQET